MDKINSRRVTVLLDAMPYAVRKEFRNFVQRAVKYFKTNNFGNLGLSESLSSANPEVIHMWAENARNLRGDKKTKTTQTEVSVATL
jgi:predicted phosphoadenosine phosphosulfate sulfurtransferase